MSSGLAAKFFTSKDIFDAESELIFQRNWLGVFPSASVQSGEYAVRRVENSPLVFFRSRKDNRLRAFHNVCSHRGAVLCDEPGGITDNSNCVTCPYHAWSYNDLGELVRAPGLMTQPDRQKGQLGLLPVACREWNGYAMVRMTGTTTFEEDFRPVLTTFDAWDMPSLRATGKLEYEVAANWKILFHNYSECYHCPTVHPSLNRLTPYKSAENDLLAGAFLGGPMHLNEGVRTMSMDGKAVAATLPGLSAEQQRQVSYYTIFPNMFVSTHPDYVMVHRLERIDVDRTHVVCEFLIQSDSNKANSDEETSGISSAVEFWDMTNRQDWHVCERVQAGTSSPGFRPATYSDSETVLPRFDRHYLNSLRIDESANQSTVA